MNSKKRVVVVGGGPAGMMAAGRAAELGAEVFIVEKNENLGKKLLLTGGGRCNLTNVGTEGNNYISHYGERKKFLYSPFSKFGVDETINFFHSKGMLTKIEAEGRVFPRSDDAQSVLTVLKSHMKLGGVRVICGARVSGIRTKENRAVGVQMVSGEVIDGDSIILATGGKSHPETGSTGEGFVWLANIGHHIVQPDLSLVPLRVDEEWVQSLAGLSFADAGLKLSLNEKIIAKKRGKMLFTHFGLSGPAILNLSRSVGDALKMGRVMIFLDIFPSKDESQVDCEMLSHFKKNQNKKLKNRMEELFSTSFVRALLFLSGLDGEKAVHLLTRSERLSLVRLLKKIPIQVSAPLGAEKAIVTSGGVPLEEIDCRFMRSRLYPNLYLVGDLLDIDRPSGGYSLQLCWTTGWVAGSSAVSKD